MKRILEAAAAALRWIGEKAPIFISISSMLIAGGSLYYTINAQRVDLEYKEVSIQPRLWLGGDWEDLSLTLLNTGLGPAIIEDVVLQVGGKCKSAGDVEADEWSEVFSSFVHESLDGLYSKTLPSMPWVKGGKRRYDVESDVLRIGDSIRPGDKKGIVPGPVEIGAAGAVG